MAFVLFACKNGKRHQDNHTDDNKNQDTTISISFAFTQSADSIENKKVLFVVIDPHGDGQLGISKFSDVIKKYNCTVIGLNDVRNNEPNFAAKIQQDINSAIKNLKLTPQKIILAGFSGGARMAYYYSTTTPINGLILCGAGAPLNEIEKSTFPIALIIGNKDFNFIEHYYSPYSNLAQNFNVLSLLFSGMHQWPSNNLMTYAASFVLGRNDIQSFGEAINFDSVANSYVKTKNYIFAVKTLENAFKSSPVDLQVKYKQEYQKLISTYSVKNYFTKYENTLDDESSRNKAYVDQLQNQSTQWWIKEINSLKQKSNQSDSILANSYARTIGYIGVAMYSLASREVSNPQSYYIDKFLQIYEILEPNNADLWFFKAVRQKQLGKTDSMQVFYQKAIDLGFSDTQTAKKFGF